MRARHPRTWLMTDERMGEGLWAALERLPRGSGVVFRHYMTPPTKRREIYVRVRKVARKRHLTLVAGGLPLPGANGVHGMIARRSAGLLTCPVHSRTEAIAAVRTGADLIFVSPVFQTRSHPGARALGPVGLGLMLRGIDLPVIALGGMDARRFKRLSPLKLHGWAAIDAWTA
jgi:thiamine-phosphate pyrophosphorylase